MRVAWMAVTALLAAAELVLAERPADALLRGLLPAANLLLIGVGLLLAARAVRTAWQALFAVVRDYLQGMAHSYNSISAFLIMQGEQLKTLEDRTGRIEGQLGELAGELRQRSCLRSGLGCRAEHPGHPGEGHR